MSAVLCHMSLSLACFLHFAPYRLIRNVCVSFQLAEMVSLLCPSPGRGHRGDGGGRMGVRNQLDRTKYSISLVTLLFWGITKGLTGG